MKDLRIGQAVLSHLTLNCEMVLVHCTVHYDNTHAYQVSSHSKIKMTKLCSEQTRRLPARGDHIICPVFDWRIKFDIITNNKENQPLLIIKICLLHNIYIFNIKTTICYTSLYTSLSVL